MAVLFHTTIEVQDAIVLDGDKQLREVLGPQIQHVAESGKMQAGGFLGGIDALEDIYALFGPEIYGNCKVEAYPVVPLEKGGQLFQGWAEEGR